MPVLAIFDVENAMRTTASLAVLSCIGVLLPMQSANSLPKECYEHLQTFVEGETWEVIGNSAIEMYNAGCWPALQNPSTGEVYISPTNCEELAPQIVQMTIEQEDEGSPGIFKLYNIVAWDSVFTVVPKGTTRVLYCIAQMRDDTGDFSRIDFYLDRDADGEEFIGWGYR